MYELINTSVPNGLIAGTHGFATVAMTKGMPDAIRTRVESFCAYPHRTSAHDQSYFRDNPVNWFHLQIPSGDHVVGRTAPAEFDYTGRTNRLAHTLVFGAKEMPIVGGAYVLGAESRRFLAAWSGEPKYLPVDKQTAGRLGLADVPRNASPSNWISVFGEDGAKYARRFAALVAKNVSGGNKSIYFKTSTSWDNDGTRLLGLFSDLINLLPEGIRPFVTFSTFAACVPNGVTCHLRGIYDKDRAFEIASATQSWVDCEHGRIVHEELLPEESEITAAAVADREVIEGSTRRMPIGAPYGGNSIGNSGRRMAHGVPSSTSVSEKRFFVKLMIALVLFVLVIVGGGYLFMQRQQKAQRDGDELWEKMQEQQAREFAEKNENAVRDRQDAENAAARDGRRIEEEIKAQRQAEEPRRKEEEVRKAKREKDENEARRSEPEKIVADAKERQEKMAMAKERAEWPQKIDAENVLFDKTLDDMVLKDGGKEFQKDFAGIQLTNEECIVVHWLDKDGTLKYKTTTYVENSKKDPRSGNITITYKLKDDVGCEATWVMYRLILGPWDRNLKQFSKEKVFWVWRKGKDSRAVFEEKGALDVQKTFFGGDEKLYALWSQIKVPKCFKYEFALTSEVSDKLAALLKNQYYVGVCWAAVKGEIVRLVLKEENEKLQKLQKNIDNADNEKDKCDKMRKKAQEDVEKAEAKNEEMKNVKKVGKGFDPNTKKAKWEEIVKILSPYFKSGTEFKMANFESYIREVKSKIKCHHLPYKHDKKRLMKAKELKESEIKRLEKALKNMVLNVGALNGSCGKGTGISKKQDVRFDNEDIDGSDF